MAGSTSIPPITPSTAIRAQATTRRARRWRGRARWSSSRSIWAERRPRTLWIESPAGKFFQGKGKEIQGKREANPNPAEGNQSIFLPRIETFQGVVDESKRKFFLSGFLANLIDSSPALYASIRADPAASAATPHA